MTNSNNRIKKADNRDYYFEIIEKVRKNDFKSFITMSPYDKKRIIDKIFGFSMCQMI